MGSIRDTLARVAPQMVVTEISTASRALNEAVAGERLRSMLASVYATVAVLLASVGLYGLVSRVVAEQHREIGIRVALGATPLGIRSRLVKSCLRSVALGVSVGALGAWWAGRLMQAVLYDVSATTPRVVMTSGLVLCLAVAIAVLGPLRRAGTIDPVVALREQG
jgi:ABC-type antimicrobial peptide transport system permease subunit